MKNKSGFLKWAVSSVFPMALLSSQALYATPLEDLFGPPPAGDVPLNPLPPVDAALADPSVSTEVTEQSVISPQAPYGRQLHYQSPSSAGYHQSSYSRNWFRRPFRRMPHFIKLPPLVPPPAGENVNTFWATQISNGEAARMVLYEFDFVPGQPELTSRGTRQLAKFADMLNLTPHSLIIQPSLEQPSLNELRRAHVLSALATMDTHISEDRLLVRIPQSRGLDGIEAEGIQAKQLGMSGGSASPGAQSGQAPQATPVATPGQ